VLKQDDHLTGFDIELGQALAKELDCAPSSSKPGCRSAAGVESGKYDIAFNKTQPELPLAPELVTSQPFRASRTW
jgi:ABC-type amino acid transport substrate-binding protein